MPSSPQTDNPPPPNSITALYQALVGPLNQPYYLGRFTRFDDIGRSFPTWNWAACLLTLNWLLFRGLWGAALGYAGAVTGAVLAVFGLGKLALGFSDDSVHALLGVGLAVAFVLPGMFGDAWYHRRCKRQLAEAILTTDDNDQAARKLAGQAPSPKRLGLLALGNAAVLAPLVAVFTLSWQLPGMGKGTGLPSVAASSPAPAVSAAAGPTSIPAPVSALAASAPPPPPAPAVATQPTASAAATAASRGDSGSISQAHELAAASTVATHAAPAHPASVLSAPAPSAPAPSASASVPQAAAKASAPTSHAVAAAPAPTRAAASKPSPAAAASVASTPAPTVAKPPPQPNVAAAPAKATKAAPQFFVDAGIYAQTGNAKRAIDSLREAKLPVVAEELDMARGVRTRVRVGPFASRALAEQAARQVKGLGLPALVEPPAR